MAEIVVLAEAVRLAVRDGDTVAMEGFTHLIPFAAGATRSSAAGRARSRSRSTATRASPTGTWPAPPGSAERSVVTVEELVDSLEPRPGAVVLPSWAVSYVAHVPNGAHPSYAMGYSERDNDYYVAWDEIARDREVFAAWLREHVLSAEGATA